MTPADCAQSPHHTLSSETEIDIQLNAKLGSNGLHTQHCADQVTTHWVERSQIIESLRAAKDLGFEMLLDLTAIDERLRQHRSGQPTADFTVVYHLISFSKNSTGGASSFNLKS